jgi:hypothetical protein
MNVCVFYAFYSHVFTAVIEEIQVEETYVKVFLHRALVGHSSVL